MLMRILRRAAKYLASFSPSEEEKRFVETNRAFWRHFWPAPDGQEDVRHVLIESSEHPIVNLCNASFGAIVCHARNLRPIYLLPGFRDRSFRRVLESYHPRSRFIYTTEPRYLLGRVWAFLLALKAWLGLQTPSHILEFQVDGIRFGDIIYDNVLVRGYATIRSINRDVLWVLYEFFKHRMMIKDIIGRYPLDSFVVAHTIGLFGGTFSRYLVKARVEVINRVGSHQVLARKYRSPADIGVYTKKPEPRYFDHMAGLPDDVVLPLATRYIEDRQTQKVDHISVELAFSQQKRLFENREEFCRVYGLDPRKKIVFVMLHAFNDHPHSHFARRLYFQDYFDWFEKTLEVARDTPTVNWVFKEHPAAEFYRTKDVDLDALFAGLGQPHIAYLDRQADFNALSVRYLAHAIVTCIGSAGMEYACFGIPCLLGGESPYSGFGFTIEPATLDEYRATLRRIGTLGPLSDRQVKAAKLVMYFEMPMMHGEDYLFCPRYGYREIIGMQPDRLLGDAAGLLQNTQESQLLALVETFKAFLNDPHYLQYISIGKYPFMAPVVSGAEAVWQTSGEVAMEEARLSS